MSLRRKLLGGVGKLMGGQVLGQVCSFGRNVIVARLLTPEDFGIAATFAIAVSLFELGSNLGVDRLLVQAEDGDDPVFQATAQAFQVLRGVGMALLIFLLAWPVSRLFNIPHAQWAFQCVALVPLIRGFTHLDAKRFQRQFGFGRDVATELIPQVLLVLAAWPFVWWFQDYSAMLWLLVFQAVITVFVSQLVAQRRYVLAWDRQFLRRMYSFGWPLLLNGLLVFLVFQGDRLIIGSVYDMTQLGMYSVAFSITFIPSMMTAKITSTLLLPVFSRERNNLVQSTECYVLAICVLSLVGVVVTTGFVFFGEFVVVTVYGTRYGDVGGFIGCMAIMQMMRAMRTGPTIASMARGDTVTPLIANLGRIAVFPAAIGAALLGKPLIWLVALGCFGNAFAFIIMIMRLRQTQGLILGDTLKPALVAISAMLVAYLLSIVDGYVFSWPSALVMFLLVTAGTTMAMTMWLPPFRRAMLNLIHIKSVSV